MNDKPSDEYGLVERYFLRSMAIERSKDYASDLVPYRNALVNVIGMTFILPSVAFFSFVGICTSRWWDPPIRMTGFVIIVCDFLVGFPFWERRLRKYKNDDRAWRAFQTDHDRQIVFWQFFWWVTICSLLIPLFGVFVASQFLTG